MRYAFLPFRILWAYLAFQFLVYPISVFTLQAAQAEILQSINFIVAYAAWMVVEMYLYYLNRSPLLVIGAWVHLVSGIISLLELIDFLNIEFIELIQAVHPAPWVFFSLFLTHPKLMRRIVAKIYAVGFLIQSLTLAAIFLFEGTFARIFEAYTWTRVISAISILLVPLLPLYLFAFARVDSLREYRSLGSQSLPDRLKTTQ